MIENLPPLMGLEPMTSCIPGKHTTTVPRERLRVVGNESPCTGKWCEGCYLSDKYWIATCAYDIKLSTAHSLVVYSRFFL